jgi:hypothetical protein
MTAFEHHLGLGQIGRGGAEIGDQIAETLDLGEDA